MRHLRDLNQLGVVKILPILFIMAFLGAISFLLISSIAPFSGGLSKLFPKPRSQAQDTSFGSTPITDVDKYPRPQNHIQTMAFYGFEQALEDPSNPGYLPGYGLTDAKKQYLAKEIDYLFFDQNSFAIPFQNNPNDFIHPKDFSNFSNVLNQMHALGPQMKFGVNGLGAGIVSNNFLPYQYFIETDFLHSLTNPSTRVSVSGQPNNYFFNINSLNTRINMVVAWQNILVQDPLLAGVVIDNYQSSYTQPPLQLGCAEGACNQESFWTPNIIDMSLRLKNQALGPTHDLIYNGIKYFEPTNSAYSFRIILGPMNSGFIKYHDGVLSEDGQEMIEDTGIFQQYIATISAITNEGKKVFLWIQPERLGQNRANYGSELELERFFLASYLLIQKDPFTYFGYNPYYQYRPYQLFFYKDWNLDFGIPQSDFDIAPGGLYFRPYTNGVAFVNPTNQPIVFQLNPQEKYLTWDPCLGALFTDSISVPPKTGIFEFYERNASCPSATPTPTSQPTLIVGDIDKNGKVDIFDYNILVGNFGKTGTSIQGDLDNNDVVNIFDYNIIVANFGKTG